MTQSLHVTTVTTTFFQPQVFLEQYLIEKPGDQTITNSTTLTNDAALTFTQTNATDIWWFRFAIRFNLAGTTSGYKFALAGSATPTNVSYTAKVFNGVSPGAFVLSVATNAFGTLINGALATTGDHILDIEGTFEAANAGTFVLQFAQNTTDAANGITVKRGSILLAQRIQ